VVQNIWLSTLVGGDAEKGAHQASNPGPPHHAHTPEVPDHKRARAWTGRESDVVKQNNVTRREGIIGTKNAIIILTMKKNV
jgi:hypothetical protein